MKPLAYQKLAAVKYTVHDPTGTAKHKLSAMNFDIYHPRGKSDESVMEVFGEDRHAAGLKDMGLELLDVDEGAGFTGEGYIRPSELEATFKELQTKHPEKAEFKDVTAAYNMPKTKGGRSIFGIRVTSNVQDNASKPRIALICNHHAREVVTPELAYYFAKQLLEGDDPIQRRFWMNLTSSSFPR